MIHLLHVDTLCLYSSKKKKKKKRTGREEMCLCAATVKGGSFHCEICRHGLDEIRWKLLKLKPVLNLTACQKVIYSLDDLVSQVLMCKQQEYLLYNLLSHSLKFM